MYEEHFGLNEQPFSIAPDPRFLYMSEQHREGLAHLLYGLQSDGGFVLLTGEVGSGKTTLCRYLLDQIPEECVVAFIFNPRVTVLELLSSICDEFRIHYPERNQSIKGFVDRINAFLLDMHAKGRRAVLIIDEAQNLSRSVLEQIRLLTNLETSKRKLLQIMLLGQPELRDKLARPDLRQLGQRIIARFHLGPLDRKDVELYVRHRLSVAGTNNEIFSPAALAGIYAHSRGIPRLVNVICDRALLGAYSQGKPKVDKRTVARASREALGEPRRRPTKPERSGFVPIAAALCAVAVAFACIYALGLLPPSLAPTQKHVQTEPPGENQQQRKPVPHRDETSAIAAGEPAQENPTTPPATASQQREESAGQPVHTANGGTPDAALPAQTSNPTATVEAPKTGENDTPAADKAPVAVDRLATLVRSAGQDAALVSLFAKWGLTLQPGAAADACRQATAGGLRCFTGNGGIREMRAWNRPAVLKLVDEGGNKFQAALLRMDERTASFAVGSQNVDIDTEALQSRFQGEFLLLWPVPAGYGNGPRKGQQGPKVAWLELQLARASGDGIQPIPSARFDNAVEQRVKQFQASNGLKPDGVIGPETLNQLMLAVSTDAPTLTPVPKGP
ncbi:MAG: AAA family ATPase [Syntrophobacteraceae bacterium]|nr:AAA family ATPase [Desulfobacteraceae bacterium]